MRVVVALVLLAPLALPQGLPSGAPDRLPGVGDLVPLRGDLHAHTGYSDGAERPADAFAAAKAWGVLDFFTVTDHSEWLAFPFRADEACIGPDVMDCYTTSLPDRLEWEDIAFQGAAATDASFVGLRGFEWSSPIEGHVNVFFTSTWVDFLMTGPAPMTGLYAWLAGDVLDPQRLAQFNHPGREPLVFDHLLYVEAAAPFMATLEVFNRGDTYLDAYTTALEHGWHVGAVGVTDGHSRDAWLNADRGHTMLLATERTPAGIQHALAARRTIGTMGTDLDARFFVDGALLGSTIERDAQAQVTATFELLDSGGEAFTRVELVGSEGRRVDVPIAPGPHVAGSFAFQVRLFEPNDVGERFVYLAAYQDDGLVLATSPVWILA